MNKIDNYSEQEIRDIYYKSKNLQIWLKILDTKVLMVDL